MIYHLISSPESFQERKYIEPITACGDRNGHFDMHDVLSKQNEPEEDLDKKSGLLPRIKRLSAKRSSKEKPKKYKYNLEVTPAERLFGSAPPSFEKSKNNDQTTNGKSLKDVNVEKNNIDYAKRPTTRLDHYTDIKPISVNVNLEDRKRSVVNDFTRFSEPKPSHRVIVPSPPPSSLLLQVAPEQSRSSWGNNTHVIGPYNASKDSQSSQKVIYTNIDHHRHPQTKGESMNTFHSIHI